MNHLHTRTYKYKAQVEKYWNFSLRHRHLHQSFHFTLRKYTNNIIFQKVELLLSKVNTVVLWAGKLQQSDTPSTRVFIGCLSFWKSDQLLMAQADPTGIKFSLIVCKLKGVEVVQISFLCLPPQSHEGQPAWRHSLFSSLYLMHATSPCQTLNSWESRPRVPSPIFWLPLLAGVEKLLTNQHRCTAANWDRKTLGALKKGGTTSDNFGQTAQTVHALFFPFFLSCSPLLPPFHSCQMNQILVSQLRVNHQLRNLSNDSRISETIMGTWHQFGMTGSR